jgi:hypothetical protein
VHTHETTPDDSIAAIIDELFEGVIVINDGDDLDDDVLALLAPVTAVTVVGVPVVSGNDRVVARSDCRGGGGDTGTGVPGVVVDCAVVLVGIIAVVGAPGRRSAGSGKPSCV